MIQERDDVVALDSAIIQHPRTWEASGPPRGLLRPARPVPGQVQAALPPGHAAGGGRGPRRGSGDRQVPGVRRRPDRAARVQPDVPDDDRAGAGGGLDRLPAPRDRAGHLPRLQDDALVRAQEAAVRHRADRQVVPQRDHARATSSSARSSSSRWRWSSSSRPTRPSSGTSTGARSAWTGTRGSASSASACACAPHTPGGALALLERHQRRRVPVRGTAGRELEGVANRGDFDLTQHAKFSREKLEWKDPQTGKGYIPHVIEPAAGLGRTVLALLCDAYDEDEIGGEKRTVLRLHPSIAPVKVAVLPLLRKDGHPEKAREIYEDAAQADVGRVRRGRQHRQALPAPGRDRHAVRGDGRPPDARGRHRDAARSRLALAGAGAGRWARATSSRRA